MQVVPPDWNRSPTRTTGSKRASGYSSFAWPSRASTSRLAKAAPLPEARPPPNTIPSSGVWFVGAPVLLDKSATGVIPDEPWLIPMQPEDLHLTLAYLGDVVLPELDRYWRSLPCSTLPPTVRVERWAMFGRDALALVVTNDGLLNATANVCFDRAEREISGFRRRPLFRPHVTFGRVRNGWAPPTPAVLSALPIGVNRLYLGSVTLFRIRQDVRSGGRYELSRQQ